MTIEEKLRDLLRYDPASGRFYWVRPPRRGVGAGLTGSIQKNGYMVIGLDNATYYCHRLAWLLVTGAWPSAQIDHINGDRLDNRWENLREANAVLNCENKRRALPSNRTGLLGAWPKRKRFYSQITVGGKKISLGTYNTADEAHAAYVKAKRALHSGCTI